jgi:muramoyltetrapeptide carboxypeptidase LdcA involved in peptidoglycan recycling
VVATSWPGSSVYPHVYQHGLATLRDVFGLEVVEYPSTRFTPDEAWRNPEARAADLNRAFADPSIAAIITVIGGDDSVRILPFIDLPTVLANPKVLLGYSDTTTQLLAIAAAGLTTFNGPAVMAGLAQLGNLPGLEAHIREILFDPSDQYEYRPYGYRAGDAPAWAGQPGDLVGERTPDAGWRWLQGTAPSRGRLTGGCIEVLDMMVGTPHWPGAGFFDGRILFLETSEDVPTPSQVGFWLRNYGAQGILARINGLVYGRPRGYTGEQVAELDSIILERLDEWGATSIPVLAGGDFGHIDPQWILPHNVLAELDPIADRFRLLEPAVS